MRILMQNYRIFTKITVLQESRSKVAKRVRKYVENTKARSKQCRDIVTYVEQQKRKVPGETAEYCPEIQNLVATSIQKECQEEMSRHP